MSTSTRFRRHYAGSGVERVARRAPGALEKMRQRILRTPLTPMWHDGPTTNNFTITSNVHMPTSTAGGAARRSFAALWLGNNPFYWGFICLL
jgi:hypothetical protein